MAKANGVAEKPKRAAPKQWDAAEALALSKFDARGYREELSTGVHRVNFVTRVSGDLVVAPDFTRLFVTIPDYQRILRAIIANDRLKRGTQLADLVAEAYAEEFDTKILAGQLRELVGKYKKRTVCKGNVQTKLEFKRLAR